MTISRVGSVSDKKASGSLALVLPTVATGESFTFGAECSDARTLGTPTGTVNTPQLLPGYPKQGGTNGRFYAWRVKLMAADSGQTVSIAPDVANKIAAAGVIYHSSNGFDDNFVDDEDFEAQDASDTSYTAPASLSTVADDVAIMFFGTRGTDPQNAPFSTPAGLTKLQEQYNTGTGATGLALYDSGGSIGGASTTFGPKTATGLSSGAGGGITILVKEQAAASSSSESLGVIPIVESTTGGGGGPSPLLVPDAGAWFGVTPQIESLSAYESRVGRSVEPQFFKLWTDVFPSASEQALCDVGGRILFFNWKMNPGWPAVASGAQDSVIDAAAARFAAWGKRCLFAPHHEPEDETSSGTPADYRAAYRRIVTRFKAAGATNVIFVWKMMGTQFQQWGTAAYGPGATGGTGNSFWPGDDVVDWVMYDPYNWYECRPGDPWRMPQEVHDPTNQFSFYDHAATNWPGKPLGIAETGTNEHATLTPTKADWFLDLLAQYKTTLTRIKGMWYFHAGPPTFCERYIHTSPEAQAAMATIGADPYFNPTRPTF